MSPLLTLHPSLLHCLQSELWRKCRHWNIASVHQCTLFSAIISSQKVCCIDMTIDYVLLEGRKLWLDTAIKVKSSFQLEKHPDQLLNFLAAAICIIISRPSDSRRPLSWASPGRSKRQDRTWELSGGWNQDSGFQNMNGTRFHPHSRSHHSRHLLER